MDDWLFERNDKDDLPTVSEHDPVYCRCDECGRPNGSHKRYCVLNHNLWDESTNQEVIKKDY